MNADAARGCLYMIPGPLHETALQCLPAEVSEVLLRVDFFYVEKATTVRRFIRKLLPDINLEKKVWMEINKHESISLEPLRQWLLDGAEVGLLSEAGCPGIADPGQRLVAEAHRLGARVVPLTGPSAVLLALMASGMNGQQFRFAVIFRWKPGSGDRLSRHSNAVCRIPVKPKFSLKHLTEISVCCRP